MHNIAMIVARKLPGFNVDNLFISSRIIYSKFSLSFYIIGNV